MKTLLLVLSFLSTFLFGSLSYAQMGKDGNGSITTSTDLNTIATNLTSNYVAGGTTIQVANTTGFSVGDLVMIYQAQGASINSATNDETWGAITNMQNAGVYEFAEIGSVSRTSITLKTGLDRSYSYSRIIGQLTFNNLVQVIKVPRYQTLTVGATANISPAPWNGKTGGITVIEVNGDLNLNGTIDVSGKGFRGGAVEVGVGINYHVGTFHSLVDKDGGLKGESVVGNKAEYTAWGGSYGRGAIGNGGGGGNSFNAAGGGGANAFDNELTLWNGLGIPDPMYDQYWSVEKPFGNAMNKGGIAGLKSSGGGRGGYGFSTINLNPLVGTSLGVWGQYGPDTRDNVGGYGGRPLSANPSKVYFGGGGGAGSHDSGKTLPGGNGGGLVIILCSGKITGAGKIIANGADGGNDSKGIPGTVDEYQSDGPSGAGGGGSVILKATYGVAGAINIQVNGGKGGSQLFPYHEAEGGGGGGGGGYVAQFNTTSSSQVSIENKGGPNGSTSTTACALIAHNFPANGATMGGAGSSAAFAIQTTPFVCSGNTARILLDAAVTAMLDPSTIAWYDAATGGNKLPGQGPIWATPILTNNISKPIAKTFYFSSGTNGVDTRFAVDVIVNPRPVISTMDATICPLGTAYLRADGASNGSTFSWSTISGDGLGSPTNGATVRVTPSISPSVYEVTVTDQQGCTGWARSTASIVSISDVHVIPHRPICLGDTAQLKAYGTSSYSWVGDDGEILDSKFGFVISVKPVIATTVTYKVTGTSPGCPPNTNQISLKVNPIPSSTTTLSGNTITSDQKGASYQWFDCKNSQVVIGTNQIFNASKIGSYQVFVRSAEGCVSRSFCVDVITTGTAELTEKDRIIIFPNPCKDVLTIQSSFEGDYSIIDELGQPVEQIQLNQLNNFTREITNLKSGFYFITGCTGRSTFHQKLFVMH